MMAANIITLGLQSLKILSAVYTAGIYEYYIYIYLSVCVYIYTLLYVGTGSQRAMNIHLFITSYKKAQVRLCVVGHFEFFCVKFKQQ